VRSRIHGDAARLGTAKYGLAKPTPREITLNALTILRFKRCEGGCPMSVSDLNLREPRYRTWTLVYEFCCIDEIQRIADISISFSGYCRGARVACFTLEINSGGGMFLTYANLSAISDTSPRAGRQASVGSARPKVPFAATRPSAHLGRSSSNDLCRSLQDEPIP